MITIFVKTATVTGNRAKDTKGEVVGEKRKPLSYYTYTVTQSTLLELELGNGNLDTKEGRRTVSIFSQRRVGRHLT